MGLVLLKPFRVMELERERVRLTGVLEEGRKEFVEGFFLVSVRGRLCSSRSGEVDGVDGGGEDEVMGGGFEGGRKSKRE